MDKNDLKVGDLISFHDWGVGGFLFGVVIEYEDKLYHNKLNIWRPKDIYFLAHGIDSIKLIEKMEDVEEYRLHEFKRFIEDVNKNRIDCNFEVNNG